jgi:hypothetical protein
MKEIIGRKIKDITLNFNLSLESLIFHFIITLRFEEKYFKYLCRSSNPSLIISLFQSPLNSAEFCGIKKKITIS